MTTTDPWFQELSRSAHEPGLIRALSHLELHLGRLAGDAKRQDFEIIHELRDELRTSATLAMEAGRRWAAAFIPPKAMEKAAGYFDWDLDRDIDAIVKTTREQPSPEINRAVHQALLRGHHPNTVVNKLAKTYQIDRARDIARTVMLNIYAKGALREMARHGYEEAIRKEIDDHKVCATCKSIDGKRYLIDRLVDLADPLTHDTHPRCRGTFIPVINPALVKADAKGTVEHTRSFPTANGKIVKNVPNEFTTFLRRFLHKQDLPFHVVFDPSLPVDSRMSEEVLHINPKALTDQDPRELILEAWAHKLWPKYQDRFENEYLLMTKMGLVRPSKTVKTPKDYWLSEFVAYKTNQLEQPFEVLWFKTTVRE